MENKIITKQSDMGIDIFPIYLSSCYSPSVPTFEHIYAEYKIGILLKETDMTKEQIKGQLSLVNQEYYTEEEVGVEKLSLCRQKPEFLEFLIANGYSFSLGKEYFNMPQKEVW